MNYFKIIFKIQLGTYESIIGAEDIEQSIELLKANLSNEGNILLEVLDTYHINGEGVLVTKFIRPYER